MWTETEQLTKTLSRTKEKSLLVRKKKKKVGECIRSYWGNEKNTVSDIKRKPLKNKAYWKEGKWEPAILLWVYGGNWNVELQTKRVGWKSEIQWSVYDSDGNILLKRRWSAPVRWKYSQGCIWVGWLAIEEPNKAEVGSYYSASRWD